MFSNIALNLKNVVKAFVEDNKHCNDSQFIACCKINGILCHLKTYISGNIQNCGVLHLGIQIDTVLMIKDGDGEFDTRILYSKPIVSGKKMDEIDYEGFYEEIKKIIPQLKISKLKGKFVTDENEDLNTEELLNLLTHPNVELNTCCVCLNMCGGIEIVCGHNICIECIDKIKPTKDEDYEFDECIICPLCREPIAS